MLTHAAVSSIRQLATSTLRSLCLSLQVKPPSCQSVLSGEATLDPSKESRSVQSTEQTHYAALAHQANSAIQNTQLNRTIYEKSRNLLETTKEFSRSAAALKNHMAPKTSGFLGNLFH